MSNYQKRIPRSIIHPTVIHTSNSNRRSRFEKRSSSRSRSIPRSSSRSRSRSRERSSKDSQTSKEKYKTYENNNNNKPKKIHESAKYKSIINDNNLRINNNNNNNKNEIGCSNISWIQYWKKFCAKEYEDEDEAYYEPKEEYEDEAYSSGDESSKKMIRNLHRINLYKHDGDLTKDAVQDSTDSYSQLLEDEDRDQMLYEVVTTEHECPVSIVNIINTYTHY